LVVLKLNKGSLLPNDHHVIRHVRKNRLRRDENDTVIGFLPQAFALRENEASLSVNQLEYFNGDWDARIRLSILLYRNTFKVSNSCAFAIGNVGNIKAISQQSGASIKIVFSPSNAIPSHSDIRHLPREENALLEALALDAFTSMVFNRDIPDIP
jgi:hypothetical protein